MYDCEYALGNLKSHVPLLRILRGTLLIVLVRRHDEWLIEAYRRLHSGIRGSSEEVLSGIANRKFVDVGGTNKEMEKGENLETSLDS